jgi:hypothetical protein
MVRRYGRIPIPLILALAVAVGVTVTIVIQITVVPPVPAVVLPIETPALGVDSGTRTYTVSVSVPLGSYALYNTLAGMGKIKIQANTTGWYYQMNDWVVTVVRRSTGDVIFTLPNNRKVVVREINNTHAVVYYEGSMVAVVTEKVQVGNTGWIVYHPVATSYPSNVRDALVSALSAVGHSSGYVFQPLPDYVRYDPDSNKFYVYLDRYSPNTGVSIKGHYITNTTSFTSISANSPVTVDAIYRIDASNYVLFPVWMFLYYQPSSNVNTALSITPIQ